MSPDALSTPSQDELLTHQLGALLGDLLREKFDSTARRPAEDLDARRGLR